MQVKLYKNLSDKKEINKSKVLLDTKTVKLLNQNTSVTSPTLTLAISDNDVVSDLNYLEIPEFNRFYYVIDKISLENGLWAVSCSCDVLESFKDDILDLNAVIDRQEYKYNLYQADEEFETYSNPVLETWKFNGFTENAYYLATSQAAEED